MLPVCLLTDYGLADEFAGMLRRSVARTAPDAVVIDLTHGIPRQDVRAGAMALWRCAPHLAPAVVAAVGDPGVATDRRAVAVEVGTPAGPLLLVGPDNGLLTPAAWRMGTPGPVVELDDTTWHAGPGPGVGTTFAGRDVFGPVAGHLASGVALARLGTAGDPASLAGGPLRLAGGWVDGRIAATVLWVDTFGNVELDVEATALSGVDRVTAAGADAVVARSYRGLGDRVGLVPDSAGLVALCVEQGSAASRLGLRAGDGVELRRP